MKKITRKQDEEKVPIYLSHDVDFDRRLVWFNGDVDQWQVAETIKCIELMLKKSKDPITIRVSSFGGDPYTALAFYDYIRALEDVPIKTECFGMAMSAGTIIFLAGDERYMTPNSTLMFHTVSTMSIGKSFEIKTESMECERLLDRFCTIYGEETNMSKAKWKRKIKYEDIFIDYLQAIDLGIITI